MEKLFKYCSVTARNSRHSLILFLFIVWPTAQPTFEPKILEKKSQKKLKNWQKQKKLQHHIFEAGCCPQH